MIYRIARYALILAIAAFALGLLISALPAGAHTNRPSIPTPHAWIKHAENDAYRTMTNMQGYCRAKGMDAEAWAEVNSDQPNGYEVIATCTTPTK